MKSEYYRKKLTKKWVKKRVFYGKGKLGFLEFLKLKMVIHMTKKKIKSRVSENRITIAFFENPFFR